MKTSGLTHLQSPLENYKVESLLGQGGSGLVFRVSAPDGTPFAAKILRAGTPTIKRRRFQNELFFGLRNNHTNIVTVLDYGEVEVGVGKTIFFVMPYFEKTFRASLSGDAGEQGLLKLFGDTLQGVEAAHLRGIVHRDLKPENVLVTLDHSRAVVSDFGAAHFAEEELQVAVETRSEERLANFKYAAPEQRDLKAATVKTDVYSLGLILNEMFTGQVPHGLGFRTIGEARPEWAALDGLVAQMLQRDETKRPEISEVKIELARLTPIALSQQELSRQRNTVLPTAEARIPDDVEIASVDWNDNKLTVIFRYEADPRWPQVLKEGRYGAGSIGGVGPERAEVGTKQLQIPAKEAHVQQMLNLAQTWIQGANAQLRRDLSSAWKRQEREAQEAHAGKIQAAERRTRVLASLKLEG
jgi:serine/threonine protein kinase